MANGLHYVVDHVFLPPKLPQKDDSSDSNDATLCDMVYQVAKAYRNVLPARTQRRWTPILEMLYNIHTLHQSSLSDDRIISAMQDMRPGGISNLAYLYFTI
jgi:hypothetical protein